MVTMNARLMLLQEFVNKAGWSAASRTFLAGDASERQYYRLTRRQESAVLMDAPPGQGDDPATFLAISGHLLQIGLSAPRCLAQDLTNGFLLLEDFGDEIYARLLKQEPNVEIRLYTAAADVLWHIQSQPAATNLPDLAACDWADAACMALDWYRFGITGDRINITDFRNAVCEALCEYADSTRVMILRDFHAENLLWLPDRDALSRVGLLDFQLAQMGQPGYDVVSLLQDARRDVSRETEQCIKAHFCRTTGTDTAQFDRSYAALGAQRALRILGVFARLCLHGGKSGYLPLIPRVWNHLQINLSTPELGALAKICAKLLPPPSSDALAKIGSQCGNFR